MAFLRIGAVAGITDLRQFYPDGAMPDGPYPLSNFDDLYGRAVRVARGAKIIDQMIDDLYSFWAATCQPRRNRSARPAVRSPG
jgi:hypothetical protein